MQLCPKLVEVRNAVDRVGDFTKQTQAVVAHLGVIDHATIDTGHGQGHADEQTQAYTGKDKLAPGMHNVTTGQADHCAVPVR